MAERIFIGVAWPYANGSLHLGHIAGCYLSADIFARFHRLKGNKVLMVSGSDIHGTPITVKARMEGKSPQEIVEHYHKEFRECWEKLGISFDIYTSTGTENHASLVREIFTTLLSKGYIYEGSMPLLYCPGCGMFLADRYIRGTCPFCHFADARGDQCDSCGKSLDPTDLISPYCRFCGPSGPPLQIRESKHFFLRLSTFSERLYRWLRERKGWRPNVLNFSIKLIEEGLKDRPITRDIEWGIPVPIPGYENKSIYVWFDAVIGYLSATIEWAKKQGKDWREFWTGDVKSYYFIGKDNIIFHAIIWPAMLMGYREDLALPYDIPANEFLTLGGKQFSTSRNWAIWLPEFLSRYDPDPLRYYLSATMPETSDSDFSWEGFYNRNNNELLATYGNLVHRVLAFTRRYFDGVVPSPGEMDGESINLIERGERTLNEAGELISGCHFREAIKRIMGFASEANRYLEHKAPWQQMAEDRGKTSTTIYVGLSIISLLKTLFYPFLPFSSQKLHFLLGLDGSPESQGWGWVKPIPGRRLPEPIPLFVKLDESRLEQERVRLGVRRNL